MSRGLRRFGLVFPLFALLLSWLATRKPARSVVLLAAVTVIQTAYYVLPAHEMGFGYRYLQPVLPSLVVLLILGLALTLELFERLPIPQQFSKLILTFTFLVPLLAVNLYTLKEARGVYLEWYWQGLMPRIIVLGHTLHAADSTGTLSVALNDCGVVAYYSGWRAVDLTGLNNRNIARKRSPQGVLEEVMRQRPKLLILGSQEGQRYKRMFRNEELLHDRAPAIGYAYAGTIPISPSYYYWAYWQVGRPRGRVIELLKERCGFYRASGEKTGNREAPGDFGPRPGAGRAGTET